MDGISNFERTLVIGNSGSGKSWFSQRLADRMKCRAFDLDFFHWEPGGCHQARDSDLALQLVRQAAATDGWVIEGVYGRLAQEALSRASALVWLDPPVEECLVNLRTRGLRRGGDAEAFAALLAWAADYPDRLTSSSRQGHHRLFHEFPGQKLHLANRADVRRVLDSVPS